METRSFEIYRIKCGTLDKQKVSTLTSETIREARRNTPELFSAVPDQLQDARRLGEIRYGKPNHFIGVEAV